MIQWINDSRSKYQNLLIFKGDNDNTTVIENINSNDLFFYNLNISEVDKTFLIYFSLNDEEKRNIKIYFTFIPSKGKNNFDNSEIQYKYLNNIQLPYFIDYREKKTFKNEILRLKYNENIIKDFYILSKFIDSNENIVLTKKIFQSNIKKFDNNYRFIQIEEENEISISKILIEFDINLKQGLSIKDNIEEFDIRRIESFIYNEINENEPLKIEANNVHKFYFFNLTSLIKEDGKSMIFYSPLLEKSKSKLYDNNFFKFYFIPNSSDTSINIFNKYSIDNNLYLQNRNITLISFISYNNEKKEEGFIDISLREKNKYEIITENEKKKIYNQNLTLNKHGNGNHFYIIKNEKNNNNKKMKLKINSSLNNNEHFNIKFYYTNEITNYTNFQNLEDNLKYKILKLGENIIESRLVEIFGYDYNIGEAIDKEISISINLEDINNEKEKNDDDNGINKTLKIILIITGALIFFGVLIFIILKLKKNNTSVNIEEVDSTELITS